MPKVDKPWTKLEERKAVELRKNKHTIASVARILGRSYGSVSVKLSHLGATAQRPDRRKRGEFLEAVRKACRKGRSDAKVAELLDSTPQEVFKARKRLGIKPGLTYSDAARRPKRKFAIRCWACNKGTNTCNMQGWQSRKLPMRGMVMETYCPDCFAQWGWPDLPAYVPVAELEYWTRWEIWNACDMRESGASLKECSDQLGRDENAIQVKLSKLRCYVGQRPKQGQRVKINSPEEPSVHDCEATVEKLTEWGAHLVIDRPHRDTDRNGHKPRWRAFWSEMIPIPAARLPETSQELCKQCGGFMVRTGSCLTCQSCGGSSGGCG